MFHVKQLRPCGWRTAYLNPVPLGVASTALAAANYFGNPRQIIAIGKLNGDLAFGFPDL